MNGRRRIVPIMNEGTEARSVLSRPPPPRRSAVLPEPPEDEHDLYPAHEEENVPEKAQHELQVRYLRGALAVYLPEKWVTGNICMYWEKGNFQQYAAPDVLVVDGEPSDPPPGVYLRWADAPPLLVIEVGSKSTFLADEGPKLNVYGFNLGVPEYLYFHPDRQELRFHRLGARGYEAVPADARGWVHSETLDVWFGIDEAGWLRIYTPEGERLRSHEEEARARAEAEAEVERLRAELARLRGG